MTWSLGKTRAILYATGATQNFHSPRASIEGNFHSSMFLLSRTQ